MSEYVCKRCGYESQDKWKLKRHLESTRPCKAVGPNAPTVADLLIGLTVDRRCKDTIPQPQVHVCSACKMAYSQPSSLSRHKLNCHATLKEKWEKEHVNKIKEEQKQEMIEENQKQKDVAEYIYPHGMEDTSFIDARELASYAKLLDKGPLHLARAIWFGDVEPKNHNIKASLNDIRRNGQVRFFNGTKWVINPDRNAALTNMWRMAMLTLYKAVRSWYDSFIKSEDLGVSNLELTAIYMYYDKWDVESIRAETLYRSQIKDFIKLFYCTM